MSLVPSPGGKWEARGVCQISKVKQRESMIQHIDLGTKRQSFAVTFRHYCFKSLCSWEQIKIHVLLTWLYGFTQAALETNVRYVT